MSIITTILETIGGACLLTADALMYQEIGEVNRKLPDDQQISYFFFYTEKVSRIRREYKRLYPQGWIDRARFALQIAALIFLLLAAVSSGFFNRLPFR